jgi:hypothetical protein
MLRSLTLARYSRAKRIARVDPSLVQDASIAWESALCSIMYMHVIEIGLKVSERFMHEKQKRPLNFTGRISSRETR